MTAPGEKPSFEQDIKPLFRQKDRDAMLAAFDLFDYDDVVEKADAIVGRGAAGRCRATACGPPSRWTRSSGGSTRARPPKRITGIRCRPTWNVLAPRRFS
jgi:hypothetical protein